MLGGKSWIVAKEYKKIAEYVPLRFFLKTQINYNYLM